MPPAHTRLVRRAAGVGAGVIAAAAAGVATSSSASADTNWDAIAACESGGNWSINTGNGFTGGLQFTSSTWQAYGGGAYSSSASGASREQQIAVAERVLAGQGIRAWPACGPRGGTSGSVSRSTTRTTPAKATTTTTRKATVTKTTASKSTVKKTTTSTATVKKSTKPANTVTVSGQTLTVKAGDTLSQLAASHGIKGGWQALYAANTSKVTNPNRIYVGQVLQLPA